MVNVCPAIVIVPVRSTVNGLAWTVYPTEPLLVPGVPNEIVIQLALLVAVREQAPEPLTTVTATVSLPPAELKDALVGLRLNTHWPKAALPAASSRPIRIRIFEVSPYSLTFRWNRRGAESPARTGNWRRFDPM